MIALLKQKSKITVERKARVTYDIPENLKRIRDKKLEEEKKPAQN